jgi:hypothetical protein
MKKFSIIADPRVKYDLEEARSYLNTKRKGFGKKFLIEYRKTIQQLYKTPHFQLRYDTIHCLPMKTFKYMIHYKIIEKDHKIHIFAVLSTYLDSKKYYKF